MKESDSKTPTIQLGESRLNVTPIGQGTWQFANGKGPIGERWPGLPFNQIQNTVQAGLDSGINWFDTAEAYGDSEHNLSSSLKNLGVNPEQVQIATKWWPKQRKANHMLHTIADRKRALQDYPISLFQIHWPESQSWLRTEMKVLAQLVEQGDIKAVGLCNYSSKLLKKAYGYLRNQKVALASIQVQYSLLNRSIEQNDILKVAQDLGVTVIAWSPLDQGKLSTLDKPATSDTSSKMNLLLEQLQKKADSHNATPAQIALAWLTSVHGSSVVAIPGASNPQQACENAQSMYVTLNNDEIDELSELSMRVSQTAG